MLPRQLAFDLSMIAPLTHDRDSARVGIPRQDAGGSHPPGTPKEAVMESATVMQSGSHWC